VSVRPAVSAMDTVPELHTAEEAVAIGTHGIDQVCSSRVGNSTDAVPVVHWVPQDLADTRC
jgi:hypothetical protein